MTPRMFMSILGTALGLLILYETIGCHTVAAGEGVVIERSFTPSSTAVGTGISGKGNPVMVTTYQSEKWTLIVRMENGNIRTVNTSREQWAQSSAGSHVPLASLKGGFTGWEWDLQTMKGDK